jgi:hypothetical protein
MNKKITTVFIISTLMTFSVIGSASTLKTNETTQNVTTQSEEDDYDAQIVFDAVGKKYSKDEHFFRVRIEDFQCTNKHVGTNKPFKIKVTTDMDIGLDPSLEDYKIHVYWFFHIMIYKIDSDLPRSDYNPSYTIESWHNETGYKEGIDEEETFDVELDFVDDIDNKGLYGLYVFCGMGWDVYEWDYDDDDWRLIDWDGSNDPNLLDEKLATFWVTSAKNHPAPRPLNFVNGLQRLLNRFPLLARLLQLQKT